MSKPAGLDKMMQRLSDAPNKARAGLKGQFAKDASGLVVEMKQRAPKKTGALAASIVAAPAKSGVCVRISAGGPTTIKTAHKGHGAYDYALAAEFGTRHEPPHPFFYPTLRAAKAALKGNAQAAVNEALK